MFHSVSHNVVYRLSASIDRPPCLIHNSFLCRFLISMSQHRSHSSLIQSDRSTHQASHVSFQSGIVNQRPSPRLLISKLRFPHLTSFFPGSDHDIFLTYVHRMSAQMDDATAIYDDLTASYRAQVISKLPPRSILSPSFIASFPPGSDISMVAESCGLMTEREIAITRCNVVELVSKMGEKYYTAVEVAEAFGVRAAIAHQLVSLALNFSMWWRTSEQANIRR